MLDNQKPHALHEAAKNLKTKHPHVLIESSGGTHFCARSFGLRDGVTDGSM